MQVAANVNAFGQAGLHLSKGGLHERDPLVVLGRSYPVLGDEDGDSAGAFPGSPDRAS